MNRTIYIAHKDGDELAHYGVRGMKWGVRREIGRDAKSAAIARNRVTAASKQIQKLSTRIGRRVAAGKTDNRHLSVRLNSAKKDAAKYREIETVLSKGLSDKDIKQGRRAVKINKVVRFALVGSMGKDFDKAMEDGRMDLQVKKRKSK